MSRSKKQRNLVAKDMHENGLYKMKIVDAKKGKGAFKRKPKHKEKFDVRGSQMSARSALSLPL